MYKVSAAWLAASRTGNGVLLVFLAGLSKAGGSWESSYCLSRRATCWGKGKTHKEVSQILKNLYPEQDGLSERSVRRYCAAHTQYCAVSCCTVLYCTVLCIRRYDSSLTCKKIDNVIPTAIAEVCLLWLPQQLQSRRASRKPEAAP